MIGSESRPNRLVIGLVWIIILFFRALPASGQQIDKLQQEMDQLKAESEATARAFEIRIAAMELELQKEKEKNAKAQAQARSRIASGTQMPRKATTGD
jgi:hypothetical protein